MRFYYEWHFVAESEGKTHRMKDYRRKIHLLQEIEKESRRSQLGSYKLYKETK